MYILLALVAACSLGIAAHYLIGDRELRGVAVTPAISMAVAALAYTGLQWAGLGEDNVWLWLISIFGAVLVAALLTLALAITRRRTDATRKAALGI